MKVVTVFPTPLRTRSVTRILAAMAAVLAMLTSLAITNTGPAQATESQAPKATPAPPPPPLSASELERAVALELSKARLDPKAMADDLASAVHDGWYRAFMPNGVSFGTQLDWLKQSEKEARSQPVLPGLRWSETLAGAAREWAPFYGSSGPYRDFAQAHGCKKNVCFKDRIERARKRVDGKLGGSIEAIAGPETMHAKSFVYTWWVSSGEWKIGSSTNPLDPNGGLNRGHRGIIGDVRMDAVGVSCHMEAQPAPPKGQDPQPPKASCVAILGMDVSDATGDVLGAPTETALDKVPATTGSVGATTGEGGTTLTVDPFALASVPDAGLSTVTPAPADKAIEVDQTGKVTALDPGSAATPPDDATIDGVPKATFDAACEGFGSYLRQEVGSKKADRISTPGCSFDSPDLQEAILEMAPTSQFPESDLACKDVTEGRADAPLSAAVGLLRSESTDGKLTAVTSSGSSEKSFPFLVNSETIFGRSVSSRAMSCTDKFVFRARLARVAGVNPLLTVNAAAEAMRRSE